MTKRGNGFTLVELLVVISIIALLIALLLPALAMARQGALSTVCMANLRSQGQMLAEYQTSFEDAIPYAYDIGIWPSDPYGGNAWDQQLFCFIHGVDSYNFGMAWVFTQSGSITATDEYTYAAEFAKTFICPAAVIPINYQAVSGERMYDSSGLYGPSEMTNYDCNPNFFLPYLPPGGQSGWTGPGPQTITFRASNVPNPTQEIAIGDANQTGSLNNSLSTPSGGIGLPEFYWWQNSWWWWKLAPLNALVSSNGLYYGGADTNIDLANYQPNGLRFRHGQTSAGTGSANVLFFDGHVSSFNTTGFTSLPSALLTGSSGLRMLNIVNPALGTNVLQ